MMNYHILSPKLSIDIQSLKTVFYYSLRLGGICVLVSTYKYVREANKGMIDCVRMKAGELIHTC